ncbi:PREDICTED: neuroglian-like [Rhagoletis zephyria]|uniref:neuroglian-like n=1 Tax=Rhagoletis zephyria TaxID=28612 RepID=UPI0008114F51|nr:PREDICTED: neuroglian-like [Rhagoletis zephyria]
MGRLSQKLAVLLLVAVLGSSTAEINSPPRIIKQPPTDELLFKVAVQNKESDKPFIIECEAEGKPDPR